MTSIDQIKNLRAETGISVAECQKALKEAGGDYEKARAVLKEWGKTFAQKTTERETKQGIIDCYVHNGKKVGAMVSLRCETDFVAKSPDFQKLAHDLCLQIAAISPDETPLFEQQWIKDPSKTIKDLLAQYVARLGENIILDKFVRYEL